MEILVCVKLVSESHYTDFFQEVSVDRLSSGRLVMNPVDEYTLELALRLRESCPGSKVILLTLGPRSAAHMLETGLARGADEAIHVCDPSFAGSDTLATSMALASAIQAIPFQGVILCGQKSIDSETGHIGPQLSVQLGIPVVTGVLSFQANGDSLQVEQMWEGNTVMLLCPKTVILTVCRGTQMVRRPTISDLRTVGNKPVRVLTHRDLNLAPEVIGAAGSPTKVVRVEPIVHRKRSGTAFSDAEEGSIFLLQLLSKTEMRCPHAE